MKKFVAILLLSVAFVSTKGIAQDNFKQAIDDFHYTLAFTYHPMVDDSNYVPIRKRSAELVANAEKLVKALDSEKTENENLESGVEQLIEECKALDDVIKKNAPDEIINSRLTSIHTKFHEIEGLYSNEKE